MSSNTKMSSLPRLHVYYVDRVTWACVKQTSREVVLDEIPRKKLGHLDGNIQRDGPRKTSIFLSLAQVDQKWRKTRSR